MSMIYCLPKLLYQNILSNLQYSWIKYIKKTKKLFHHYFLTFKKNVQVFTMTSFRQLVNLSVNFAISVDLKEFTWLMSLTYRIYLLQYKCWRLYRSCLKELNFPVKIFLLNGISITMTINLHQWILLINHQPIISWKTLYNR